MDTPKEVSNYPPMPSSDSNIISTCSSASAILPSRDTIIPLPDMLEYIQRYLARLHAESHDMQKQLHDINECTLQHPQESDLHHCASITIDSTNPVRQHLRDDHPPTIPIPELKDALSRAICRNQKLHKDWEMKKAQVQERLKGLSEARKRVRFDLDS